MEEIVEIRTVLLAVGLLACGTAPPEYLSDEAEAAVYGRVLSAARSALTLPVDLVVHPYRAVAEDTAGHPSARLDAFEYEPAAPLRLLANAYNSVVLCEPNAQGTCNAASYLVVSEMLRTGPRDAAVVVLFVDRGAAGRPRSLVVRLRYGREGWYVAGTEPRRDETRAGRCLPMFTLERRCGALSRRRWAISRSRYVHKSKKPAP